MAPRRATHVIRTLLAVAAVTVVATAGCTAVCSHITINVTPSLPRGLYWLTNDHDPRRGSIVVLFPPAPFRELIAQRGYLPSSVPLLKRVVGHPWRHRLYDRRALPRRRRRPRPRRHRRCCRAPAATAFSVLRHRPAWRGLRRRPRTVVARLPLLRPRLSLHPHCRGAFMDVLLTLILSCSVHLDDSLVEALAYKLSIGNQYFVADLTTLNTYDTARTPADALRLVDAIKAVGGRPAVGYMSVPLDWAARFGRQPDDLFDGCTNIAIGTAMLSDYARLCTAGSGSPAPSRIQAAAAAAPHHPRPHLHSSPARDRDELAGHRRPRLARSGPR